YPATTVAPSRASNATVALPRPPLPPATKTTFADKARLSNSKSNLLTGFATYMLRDFDVLPGLILDTAQVSIIVRGQSSRQRASQVSPYEHCDHTKQNQGAPVADRSAT